MNLVCNEEMHTSDLLKLESSQGQIDQPKNAGERPGL